MEILNPQQLALDGRAEYQKKAYLSAARLYQAAAEGFSAAGERARWAEMANDASVAFLKGGQAQSALDAADGTEQVFAENGDTKQLAIAIGNRAAALEKLKRHAEAMAQYERSAKLLFDAGELELRAYVLQSMSSLYMRQGRYLEAYAAMREGIMRIEKPSLRQKLLKSLIQIPFKLLR